MEKNDVYSDDDDVISGLNEEESRIPQKPVCGTVLTEPSDTLDLVGKLMPGNKTKHCECLYLAYIQYY